jgi:hypothetical protein
MAHFAIINKSDNKVIQVVRVDNSKLWVPSQELRMINVAPIGQPEQLEQRLVTVNVENEQEGIDFISNVLKDTYNLDEVEFHQTSYNEKMRYNFAGIGDTYDKANEAFIKPMPIETPVKKEEVIVKGKIEQLMTTLVGEWTLDDKYKWKFNESVK